MRTLLITLAVCYSLSGWSQFIIEPLLGSNLSWTNSETVSGVDKRFGIRPVVGFGSKFDVNDKLTFMPALIFEYKGENYTVPDFEEYRSFNAYVAVLLVVDYHITDNVAVYGGITPSYWASSKTYVTDIGGGLGDRVTGVDLTAQTLDGRYNRMELVLTAGVQPFSLTIGSSVKVNLRVSYNVGVNPIFQPTMPQEDYPYQYNRWIRASLHVPILVNT